MSQTQIVELGQQGLQLALLVAAPLLLISLVVGACISLIQVATSLQDVTLTFVPKIFGVGLALLLLGPWMIGMLLDFTRRLITGIPGLLG